MPCLIIGCATAGLRHGMGDQLQKAQMQQGSSGVSSSKQRMRRCIPHASMRVDLQGSTVTCTADRHKLVPRCMVVQRLQGLLNLVQLAQPPLQIQHVHGRAGGRGCGCKHHSVLCSTCSGSGS